MTPEERTRLAVVEGAQRDHTATMRVMFAKIDKIEESTVRINERMPSWKPFVGVAMTALAMLAGLALFAFPTKADNQSAHAAIDVRMAQQEARQIASDIIDKEQERALSGIKTDLAVIGETLKNVARAVRAPIARPVSEED